MTRSAVAAMFVLAPASGLARPRYGLAPDAYGVFSRSITATYVGDEALAFREALRRYRTELAPAFRQALAEGPPPDALRAVRTAANRVSPRSRDFPWRFSVEGATAQALAQHRRVSRQSFVNDQVQRYATGYGSNAVAGLGIVGRAETRQVLSRLATRRGDPLALAATEAIKGIEPPMSAAGPSQGANSAPFGGSAAAELSNEAASVGERIPANVLHEIPSARSIATQPGRYPRRQHECISPEHPSFLRHPTRAGHGVR